MRLPDSSTNDEPAPDARWRSMFDDRYGPGSGDELLRALGQPCVTFAAIAERFGVTRERVRQWHLELMPGAPRGHERQRLCWMQRQKRQVLQDALFRSFYAHVRRHFGPKQVGLLATRNGYRRYAVQLNQQIVLIRDARRRGSGDEVASHTLRVGLSPAAFIYYRLSADDFLFVPRSVLPVRGTVFVDNGGSKYVGFKNAFEPALAYAAQRARWHYDDRDGPTGARCLLPEVNSQ